MLMPIQQSYNNLISKTIIILNTIIIAISIILNDFQFESFKENMNIGPSINILLKMGAKSTTLIQQGEIHRLFIPIFLHLGLFHLLINNLAIYKLGFMIEETFGKVKLLIIYLVSGIYGWIMSSIFLYNVTGVGSSPAIFGLLGALFADIVHNHQEINKVKTYSFGLIINAIICFVLSLMPYVDNWSHIGGCISGFLCGLIILNKPKYQTNYTIIIKILAMISLIILFIVSIIALYNVKLDLFASYQWYDRFNCIETKWWSCKCKAMNLYTHEIIDIHC